MNIERDSRRIGGILGCSCSTFSNAANLLHLEDDPHSSELWCCFCSNKRKNYTTIFSPCRGQKEEKNPFFSIIYCLHRGALTETFLVKIITLQKRDHINLKEHCLPCNILLLKKKRLSIILRVKMSGISFTEKQNMYLLVSYFGKEHNIDSFIAMSMECIPGDLYYQKKKKVYLGILRRNCLNRASHVN